MKIKLFFLPLAILGLSSCQEQKLEDGLVGKWDVRLKFSTQFQSKKFEEKSSKTAYTDKFWGLNYFVFNPDDTFILFQRQGHGKYIRGNYKVDPKDSIIYFKSQDSVAYPRLKIRYLKDQKLSLVLLEPNVYLSKDEFDLEDKDNAYLSDFDPKTLTSPYNYTDPKYNKWREKPTARETDAQIKERMKAIFTFTTLFFQNSKEIKESKFNRQSIPAPLQIYNNGVGMLPFEKCYQWRAAFYDEQDAKKAYDIILGIMKNKPELPKDKHGIDLTIYISQLFQKSI